jgi:hypothetical protein
VGVVVFINNNAVNKALLFFDWSGEAAEDGVAESLRDGAMEGGAGAAKQRGTESRSSRSVTERWREERE